jgi:cytochrome c553
MKRKIMVAATLLFCLGLILRSETTTNSQNASDGRKPPDVVKLATEAKLGPVTFNHADHAGKNRSADLKGTIDCVHCHHTAQPAAEAAKHPPHKTAWPADRTTTLTADLFTKDPNAPEVNACTDCHARAGTKPKLLAEIPTLKFEGSEGPTALNNQQAFHRGCGSCHDEVAKIKPDSTGPTSKKCTACHKKTA